MPDEERIADDADVEALHDWATLPWASEEERHKFRHVRALVCRVVNRLRVKEEKDDLDTLASLLSYWPRDRRGLFSLYGPTALARDAFEIVNRLYPDDP